MGLGKWFIGAPGPVYRDLPQLVATPAGCRMVFFLTFWCFFGGLHFHVFLFFLDSILIDFWTPRLLKSNDFYNRNSTLPCFQKVSILDDFWPPQMSPKPRFVMFFGLSFFKVFLFFRHSHFPENVVLRQREHHL